MKKVCVVINSRANYARIKSFMRAVNQAPDLELQTVVGASAVLYRFGNVRDGIVADGFEIHAEMHTVVEGNEPVAMAMSAGLAGIEISGILNSLAPDVVVVVADRYEQIATAVSASFMNIPVAHLQGGELTGSIDDSVRHAITKLSHLHFPATQLAADRLLKMGEQPESIHLVGCPSLDLIGDALSTTSPSSLQSGVGPEFNLEEPYIVVVQHPVTTEYLDAYSQVSETLSAVELVRTEVPVQVLWLWPNVDAGSDAVSKKLREYRELDHSGSIRFVRNFSPEDYVRVVSGAKCLVGNSSSGIREASFLGVPAVNIGSRQSGRERAENVVDVSPSAREIASAVTDQVKHGPYVQSNLYGSGDAGQKMADVIRREAPSINKSFYDG